MVPRKQTESTGRRKPGPKQGAARLLREKLSKCDHLLHQDLETIYQSVRDACLDGDQSACKLLLDRGWPARRGRPLGLDIGSLGTVADCRRAVEIVTEALSLGTVTDDEADKVMSLISRARETLAESDLDILREELEELKRGIHQSRHPRAAA